VAAILLASAGLLHFGYTLPNQRAVGALAEEHRRALEKLREVQERRELAERRKAEYQRVAAVLASAARGSDEPAPELRRSVLEALEGAGLVGVRVTVGAGRDSVGATLQVSGRGRAFDVVRFSGTLVQPGTGVVLERVRLWAQPTAIAFDITGVRLRGPR
jgi:beta-phosphoglucomutase-like phosphatase (HAD superfamily)